MKVNDTVFLSCVWAIERTLRFLLREGGVFFEVNFFGGEVSFFPR